MSNEFLGKANWDFEPTIYSESEKRSGRFYDYIIVGHRSIRDRQGNIHGREYIVETRKKKEIIEVQCK